MRGLLGSLVEMIHLLGVAFLVGASASLTLLTAPTLQSERIGLTTEQAGHLLLDLLTALSRAGLWLAAVVFVAALAAPIVRGDSKRGIAWMRTICAAGALAMMWFALNDTDLAGPAAFVGDVEAGTAEEAFGARSDRRLTPWTALLVFSSLNMLLAAFQIRAAGRGPTAKKRKKPATE